MVLPSQGLTGFEMGGDETEQSLFGATVVGPALTVSDVRAATSLAASVSQKTA